MSLSAKVLLTVLLLGGVGVVVLLVVPLFKDEYKSNEVNVPDVPDRDPAPTPVPEGPFELHLGRTLVDGKFEVLEKDHGYYKSTLYRPLEALLFKVFVGDHLLWDGTATNTHCTLVWVHENSTFHGIVLYLSGPETTGHFWHLKAGKWTHVREHEYSFALFSADLDVTGDRSADVDLVVTGNHNEANFVVKRNYDETFQTLVITPRNCTLRRVYFTPDDLVWDGTADKTRCILVWAHKHVNFSGVKLYISGDSTQVADLFFMKKDNVWTKVTDAEYSYHLFKHAYELFSKSGHETALRGGGPGPAAGDSVPTGPVPGPTGVKTAPTSAELKEMSSLELVKGAVTSLYDYLLPPVVKSTAGNDEKGEEGVSGAAPTGGKQESAQQGSETAGVGDQTEGSADTQGGDSSSTGVAKVEGAQGASGSQGGESASTAAKAQDGQGSGNTQGSAGSSEASTTTEDSQRASGSTGTGSQGSESTSTGGSAQGDQGTGATQGSTGSSGAGTAGTEGKASETSQSTGGVSTGDNAAQSGSGTSGAGTASSSTAQASS